MTGRVMAVAVCLMVLVSVSAHAAARKPDKAAIDRFVEKTWPKKAKLIKWVIQRESRYDPKAKRSNCVGLMQVNTGVWLSKKDPKYNLIKLGVIRSRSDLYQAIPNLRAGVYILKHYNWDYQKYRGK